MRTGDLVTTRTGKTGPIVEQDKETVTLSIVCRLKHPIRVTVRYDRRDVTQGEV